MNADANAARRARQLRASRDRWRQRAAQKQQEIRQLRVTARDLSISREHWKARAKALEEQLRALQTAPSANARGVGGFLGGQWRPRSMPAT